MRDDKWLYWLLDDTWDRYFADVPQENDVRIEWGRRAKNRLGSIKLDAKEPSVSVITINSLFKDERVPEFVIRATLVHELSHYAHGFNSPLARRQQHPHAGGVMWAEFKERGLEQLYLDQRRWLKANWREIVEAEFPVRTRRTTRTSPKIPKPFWFIG